MPDGKARLQPPVKPWELKLWKQRPSACISFRHPDKANLFPVMPMGYLGPASPPPTLLNLILFSSVYLITSITIATDIHTHVKIYPSPNQIWVLKPVKLCLQRLLGRLQKAILVIWYKHSTCTAANTEPGLALSTDAAIPLLHHVVVTWITTKLLQEYSISLPVNTSHSCACHKTSQLLLSN